MARFHLLLRGDGHSLIPDIRLENAQQPEGLLLSTVRRSLGGRYVRRAHVLRPYVDPVLWTVQGVREYKAYRSVRVAV